MMSWPTCEQVAELVDHTLLKPEATAADVVEPVFGEAADLGVCAVCVSPSMVLAAVDKGARAGQDRHRRGISVRQT